MTGIVKSLTSSGSKPAPLPPPEPPPPVPTVDTAAQAVAGQQTAASAQAAKKGRAASILTGSKGAGTPTSAVKTLLGG